MTPYHARYFANEIMRQHLANNVERLSRSLFDSCVDLNPHQIDAALFALRPLLSKGVIPADKVGLSKIIEAGVLLCHFWAEQKRKLLAICPASLRKQWALELQEKFNLPSEVPEARAYRRLKRQGCANPFALKDRVLICSYNFATRMKEQLRSVPWNLAVIDEAHKLRNVYRPSNKMGQKLKWALSRRKTVPGAEAPAESRGLRGIKPAARLRSTLALRRREGIGEFPRSHWQFCCSAACLADGSLSLPRCGQLHSAAPKHYRCSPPSFSRLFTQKESSPAIKAGKALPIFPACGADASKRQRARQMPICRAGDKANIEGRFGCGGRI